MKNNRFRDAGLGTRDHGAAMPASLLAQQSTSLAGTAKDEAKKPYTDYTVRARNVTAGTHRHGDSARCAGRLLADRSVDGQYIVELLDKNEQDGLHRRSVRHVAAADQERHDHRLQQELVTAWLLGRGTGRRHHGRRRGGWRTRGPREPSRRAVLGTGQRLALSVLPPSARSRFTHLRLRVSGHPSADA